MARIVYAVNGLRGSLYHGVEFGRRLKCDGHDVTFVGFRDVAAEVKSVGCDWARLDDGPRLRLALDERVATDGTVRAVPMARRLRRAMIESNEVTDTIKTLRPDAMVVDAEMHGVVLPALALGIPTVLTIPWFSPFRARDLPPLHTGLDPPKSRRERARVAAAWESLFARRTMSHTVGRLAPRAWRERTIPFQLNSASITNVRAVARFHGVSLRQVSTRRQWVAPLMYPSIPHLAMTAAEMDYPHESPPQLHYVGPMIADGRAEPLVTDETRRRWERFRSDARDQQRRIVYASMGSLQPGNAAFYRRLVDAVDGRDDLSLVLGLGRRVDEGSFVHVPSNVLLLDYAPQLEVLEVASLAIHHGGIGTINECVYHGVPSLAASSGFVDEPGAVARLVHHRLGLGVTMNDIMGPSLPVLVDRIMADVEIRDQLARMRAVLRSYRGRRMGERVVDDLLTSACGSPWSR